MGSIDGARFCDAMDDEISRIPEIIVAQYLSFVDRTWLMTALYQNPSVSKSMDFAIVRAGLVGEAGEVVDAVKKGIRSGLMDWRGENLMLEIGDVLYYLTHAIQVFGGKDEQERLQNRLGEACSGSNGLSLAVQALEHKLKDENLVLKLADEVINLAAVVTRLSLRMGHQLDNIATISQSFHSSITSILGVMKSLDMSFRDVFVLNASKIKTRMEPEASRDFVVALPITGTTSGKEQSA